MKHKGKWKEGKYKAEKSKEKGDGEIILGVSLWALGVRTHTHTPTHTIISAK